MAANIEPKTTRVITGLTHGGRAVPQDLIETVPGSRSQGLVPLPTVTANEPLDHVDDTVSTPFDYLFQTLAQGFPASHLPREDAADTVAALRALGSAMIDGDSGDDGTTSPIPPVYTYWGQFIDHDITANTDREVVLRITDATFVPELPSTVTEKLRNLRQPQLNLDSLYGDGPQAAPSLSAVPYVGNRFKLGDITPGGPNVAIPAPADVNSDLPRRQDEGHKAEAQIGDARNDENLIIAQLHLAFLRFHNAVVGTVPGDQAGAFDQAVFDKARELVTWHYQWLVVHDFLETVTAPGTVDRVLGSQKPLVTLRDGQAYMPLEFSVAAYRFGHSMVRATYDWNRNFGDPQGAVGNVAPHATFEQLFEFTGNHKPPMAFDLPSLPSNWPAEWERLVHKNAGDPERFARKIDTRLVPPLFSMENEGNGEPRLPIRAILKSLAVRNLLRGYKLAIPTGQAVAKALRSEIDVQGRPEVIGPPLSSAELVSGTNEAAAAALADGGFLASTPLWFYILKEAEVRGNGDHLGPVGSTIVAETIIGQIRNDPDSYLNAAQPWDPAQGVTGAGGEELRSIAALMRFAGVL
jgi:hypothetical protein